MSAKPKEVLWKAEPHTLAKIKIVAEYVYVWARVLGRARPGQPLTYLDGFAGPGEYKNNGEGSPLAALRALVRARTDSGANWKAGDVRTAFVEADTKRADHLSAMLKDEPSHKGVHKGVPLCSSFADGLAEVERQLGAAFFTEAPLLAFVDPFGATGVPFETIARILSSPTSELILNFDADGVARIFASGESSKHEALLDSAFGSVDWRTRLTKGLSHSELSRAALSLYTSRLKQLPGVRYVFAFEMSGSAGSLDYFIVFASQHPVGLRKMKEVMRKIDQTGAFQFRDAGVGQASLFRYDHPEEWLTKLRCHFVGRTVSLDEIEDFVLNETPFAAFKKELLAPAERNGWIEVTGDSSRKKATFPEDKVLSIKFIGGTDAKAKRD